MHIYERWGVRRVINAVGNLTILGGSVMSPQVVEAMAEASESFVDLKQFMEIAHRRVAELAGVEAAFVSSGAAAGVALATAACVTGKDPAKAARLPDTVGMKNEMVIHRRHRNGFDHSIRMVGVKMVEVGLNWYVSPWELESAINDQTAAVAYFMWEDARETLPLEKVVEIAHRHDVPVIVDAAAELPPAANLSRFNQMGADLVVFSGGKHICGPQTTGLVLGKKDLVEACALNSNPGFSLGRPFKVSKEALAGMVRALELYMERDFDAEMRRWQDMTGYWLDELSDIPHVRLRMALPGESPVRPRSCPRVRVELDEEKLGKTKAQVVEALWEGEPSISVDGQCFGGINLSPQVLTDGEEKVVARRMREVLTSG
jgi:L-seryl-tRNA(Ser) seleniumtransferase